MSLFHFNVTPISRGKGRSAVASAAYIAGEKIYDEYYGKTHDYTKKSVTEFNELVICELFRFGNQVLNVSTFITNPMVSFLAFLVFPMRKPVFFLSQIVLPLIKFTVGILQIFSHFFQIGIVSKTCPDAWFVFHKAISPFFRVPAD